MTLAPDNPCLLTVGHSNHPVEAFHSLLAAHGVRWVIDVRSNPYSRFHSQFDRESLAATLQTAGFSYLFLGRELGARRTERECYDQGRAVYERIARLPLFLDGLDRVRQAMRVTRPALLCAERDPLECHRAILICRQLRDDRDRIAHIREDGRLESHTDAELRLLALCKLPVQDLFRDPDQMIQEAYRLQGRRIAYVDQAESPEQALP